MRYIGKGGLGIQQPKELLLFAFFSLVSFFSLAGCGFSPVYGSHDNSDTPVSEQLNLVAIDGISDRTGQELRNYLIDRMYGRAGRPSQPQYHLIVKLHYVESDVGILANATSTLAELDNYGDYKLTDAHDKVLLTGTAHSVTSYSRLNNQYSTLTAHDSALDRTAHEISEQIVNRISTYFAESPNPDKKDETTDRPD